MKKYVKMPFWKFCWNSVGIGGGVISTGTSCQRELHHLPAPLLTQRIGHTIWGQDSISNSWLSFSNQWDVPNQYQHLTRTLGMAIDEAWAYWSVCEIQGDLWHDRCIVWGRCAMEMHENLSPGWPPFDCTNLEEERVWDLVPWPRHCPQQHACQPWLWWRIWYSTLRGSWRKWETEMEWFHVS